MIVLLAISWFVGQTKSEQTSLLNLPDHSIIELQLKEQTLKVELVNTPASIMQGLGGRESLETDGMLFVFDQPAVQAFWMKAMRFPIDIIWLSNGQIVSVERNVQPPLPDTTDDQLEQFTVPSSVNMVLETRPFLIKD